MGTDFSGRLLGSTSLTPTYHKGGGGIVAVALTVAVSVAATWAAPIVASAMVGAGASAATITAATVAAGAGLGAIGGGLTSALTGGNPLKGALMGAAGGAVGGYFNAPTSGIASPGYVPADWAGNVGAAGVTDAGIAAGVTEGLTAPTSATSLYTDADLAAYGAGAPATDAAATLSDSPVIQPYNYPVGTDPSSAHPFGMPPEDGTSRLSVGKPSWATEPGSLPRVSGNAVRTASLGDGTLVSDAGGGYVAEPQWPAPASMAPPVSDELTTQIVHGAPYTPPRSFSDRLSDFGSGMADKLSDPKFYAEAGLKTGIMAGTNALVNKPNLSPEQRRAYQMQMEAFEDQKRQAAEVNAFRAARAGEFLTAANYQDPNYQAAQDYATALNRQKRVQAAEMAGVSPAARQQAASLRRGYALDTARGATGAFDTGYQRGLRQQAGLRNLAGTYAPQVDRSAIEQANTSALNAANQYKQLKEERENVSDILTPMGADLFGVTDLRGEAERRKQDTDMAYRKRLNEAGLLFPPARS